MNLHLAIVPKEDARQETARGLRGAWAQRSLTTAFDSVGFVGKEFFFS